MPLRKWFLMLTAKDRLVLAAGAWDWLSLGLLGMNLAQCC